MGGVGEFDKNEDERVTYLLADLEVKLAQMWNDLVVDVIYIQADQFTPEKGLHNRKKLLEL